MSTRELKAEIGNRFIEFERAMKNGSSNAEILDLYKRLKELKYQLARAELKGSLLISTTKTEKLN